MGKTVKELPETLRPFEKAKCFGVGSLSDAELLALIFRSGTKGQNVLELSEQVLRRAGGTLSMLYQCPEEEFRKIKGIGEVRFYQLLALLDFSSRVQKSRRSFRMDFSGPQKIVSHYMEEMRNRKNEVLLGLFLDTKCKLLRETLLTSGSVNQTVVPVRELFMEALKAEAVFLILLHNHPSGDPSPSGEDIAVTNQISEAGKMLGIPLQDHIIIGDGNYISFREQGMIK